MSVRDLREERAKVVEQLRAMTDKPEGEAGDLSVEQTHKWKSLQGQVEALEQRIKRQEFLDEQERRMQGENITGNGDHHLDRELRNYSLLRAVGGAAGLPVDDGFEREIDSELKKKSSLSFQGRAVPMSIFTHAPREQYEQRVVTTALPAGGPGANVISTDYRGDQFVDMLRARSVVYRAGARMVTGLTGNVTIPSLTKSTGFAWVAENAAITPTDPEYDPITLAPKHGGGITEYSRNMLLQSSPEIETLFRSDMAQVIAGGIDKAAVKGGGSNEPVGILGTSGIGDVPGGTDGLAPTWLNVLALIATVEAGNGNAMGFLTTPQAVGKMRGTVRVSSTDSRAIMEEPNSLAGYPLQSSSNVPSNLVKGGSGAVCSALIFGDWSEVLIGTWSELDILVNPYETTAYTKGNVQIRAMCTVDVKLRHTASFAATKDLLTT